MTSSRDRFCNSETSNIGRLLVKCYWSVFCANKSDLEYWHFVGDLGLELHLLGVVELEEEVGGKAAVEA